MNLMQLRTAQWLTILGAVAGILGLLAIWESVHRVWLMGVVVMLAAAFFLLELAQERISVLVSGVSRFYRSFPHERNREVFAGVKKEYCYLGLSFTSVGNAFREWYETERRGNVRVRLLLLDPEEMEVATFQARYEHDLFDEKLTGQQEKLISETVQRLQQATRLTAKMLASLPPGGPKVEVRLHRERIRKWMHIVDGEELYMGVLQRGASGLSAPVVVVKPRHGKWTLFNHYRETWESIWAEAKPGAIGAGVR